jgi:antitoxin MazE
VNAQVGKWGNSLAVRIPGPYAKDLGLQEGTELEVTLSEGAIVFKPRPKVYTLEELVAGITPENVHGETDWGEAVGRESW